MSIVLENVRGKGEKTDARTRDAVARSGDGLSLQEQVIKPESKDIDRLGESLSKKKKPFKPAYIQACEKKQWTVTTWRKDDPLTKDFHCFECRSWRCSGKCSRHNAAQWFARIRTAFDRYPGNWVFLTLTLDRRDWKPGRGWSAEETAFKESNSCWHMMRCRLRNEFGKFQFVLSVEQHKAGWPHFHIALQNEKIFERCVGEGWKEFRKSWLKPAAVACGFGYVLHIEPARDLDAIAGYVVKSAGNPEKLPGELVKESQLPVNAPKGFRRIRASKGFLPPKSKNLSVTGSMAFWSSDDLADEYVRQLKKTIGEVQTLEGEIRYFATGLFEAEGDERLFKTDLLADGSASGNSNIASVRKRERGLH